MSDLERKWSLRMSEDELEVLHNMMVHALDRNDPDLPECTWGEDCLSCNLYKKIYELWRKNHDGEVP